jgi:hypothetical protein
LAGNREYDPERFEDLVLFIAWTMRENPRFGRTKLAKTLFYVDFDAYAGEGQSLTGATYEHREHGPVPPDLDAVEQKLVLRGRADLHSRLPEDDPKLLPRREPIPRRPFEERIKLLVTNWAKELAEEPSWQVEDAPHRHRGWELTAPGEEIPYPSHFIPRRRHEPPEWVIEGARRSIRERERQQS